MTRMTSIENYKSLEVMAIEEDTTAITLRFYLGLLQLWS